MSDESGATGRVGDRLRGLREAQGLDLSDVAARTRIPLRHLEAIEASDYAALPSQTYALGFVRSYARSVGANDTDLAAQLRAELGREPLPEPGRQVYEPVDETRLPSKLLAFTALILAVLVVGGYALWRNAVLGGDVPVTEVAETSAPSPVVKQTPVVPPQTTAGQVVLTATAPVWVKISDGGNNLVMRELAANERYEVPLTAADPRIQTGKAEALSVTVDGKPVAPLGSPAKTIKNVSLKAAALTATPGPSGTAPVAPVQANGDNSTSPAPAQ
jgi:cytoskeleton protein RodZ